MPTKTTKAKPAVSAAEKRAARSASAAKKTPVEPKAVEPVENKGYDPAIPLEDRTQAEKEATLAAHAAVDSHAAEAPEPAETMTAAPKTPAKAASKPKATAAKSKAAPKPAKAKAAAKDKPETPRQPSLRSEAEEVLRAAGKPMHVNDILDAVLARKKAVAKGKTPRATLASIMLRSDKFKKTGPGIFDLAS